MDEIQKQLQMDSREIKEMFGEVDVNGDGEISLDEVSLPSTVSSPVV